MTNFYRRTYTAVWIVVFILGGFLLHPLSFFLTGLIIIAVTQYEYYMLIKSTGIHPQTVNGIIAGLLIYTVSTMIAAGMLPFKYYLLFLPVVFIIMVIELYRKEERPFDSLAHTLFAILYIAVPFSMYPFAAFSRTGLESLLPHPGAVFSPGVVVGFYLILWANDTGAYLIGKSFGRRRLMERISPKKSWEGFLGGAAVAILAAWLLSGVLGIIPPVGWIITATIITVTGTFGDLFESMLKRSMGVKDSGSILPGHGGFLDRFDSAIISFPFVYLFISLFV